jgi:hypothetical protein
MIHSITTPQETPGRNPGIVPPWLQPAKNPGIVPPWLLDQPIHILPVDETVGGDTQFVSESVDASPASLADALRGR